MSKDNNNLYTDSKLERNLDAACEAKKYSSDSIIAAAEIKQDIVRILNSYDTKTIQKRNYEYFSDAREYCYDSNNPDMQKLAKEILDLQNNIIDISGIFKDYKMQKAIDKFEDKSSNFFITLGRSIKNRVFSNYKHSDEEAGIVSKIMFIKENNPSIPVVDPYILTPEEKRIDIENPKDQAKFEKIKEATKGNVKLVSEVDRPSSVRHTPEQKEKTKNTKTMNSADFQ